MMRNFIQRSEAIELIAQTISKLEDGNWLKNYIYGHYERLIKTLTFIPVASVKGEVFLDVGTEGFMLEWIEALGYESPQGTRFKKGLDKASLSGYQWSGKEYCCAYLNSEKNEIPFGDESIDVITVFEVIEHFTSDSMFFLLEAKRILKTGGVLILSTPNSAGFEAIIQALNKLPPMLFYKFHKGGMSDDRHHLEYTPELLKDMVGAAGLTLRLLETHDDKPHIRIKHPYMYDELVKFMQRTNRSTELRDRRIYLMAEKKENVGIERFPPCLYI